MKQALVLTVLLLVFLGAGSCSSLVIDKAVSAVDGNDYTIVLGGFGATAQKGYLFAQLREGQSVDGAISLYFPATECKRESCAKYQFFRPDGSTGPAASIGKGFTSASLSVSELVGHADPITRNDEGEYPLWVIAYFTGPDAIEYSTVVRGFVRLNVLRADYRPLVCADPAKAYSVEIAKDCSAEYSTAGRSVICGRCAP